MTLISQFIKAYTRTYSDTGHTVAYVEWIDTRGKPGRTEGAPNNPHMFALIEACKRAGIEHIYETW